MSTHPRVTGRLMVATVLATVVTAANPLIVRWAYQDWNSLLVVLGIAPMVPLLWFAGVTLWQERQARPVPTFAASLLATVLFLMSIWVLVSALLGFFVVLLGLVVLPMSAGLLACAWVQPRPPQRELTRALGIAAVPFIIWFAGRADDYTSEALISGVALVGISGVMFSLRRARLAERPSA